MIVPDSERMVLTLTLTDCDAHQICLYDVGEAKSLREYTLDHQNKVSVLTVMGIDCLLITDYVLLPMDILIAKQIIKTYVGTIGLRGHNYYTENTLLSALDS